MTSQKRGRKLVVKKAVASVETEFQGVTVVNVARVPRIDKAGAWLKSPRGSLLMDTLCFPHNVAVGISAKDKADTSKWRVSLDGTDYTISDARQLAIGFGSLKDTTTGIEYMLRTADDMDAMPAEVKKTIIRRCKRVTTIKRLSIVCKLLDGLKDMQGIGDCFTDAEKVELFNKPALLLNQVKDALNKVQKEKATKPAYFSIMG